MWSENPATNHHLNIKLARYSDPHWIVASYNWQFFKKISMKLASPILNHYKHLRFPTFWVEWKKLLIEYIFTSWGNYSWIEIHMKIAIKVLVFSNSYKFWHTIQKNSRFRYSFNFFNFFVKVTKIVEQWLIIRNLINKKWVSTFITTHSLNMIVVVYFDQKMYACTSVDIVENDEKHTKQ